MPARDLNLIVDADGQGQASLTFQLGSEAKNMYKIVHTASENDVLNVKTEDGTSVLKVMGASTISKAAGKATTSLLETERLAPAQETHSIS